MCGVNLFQILQMKNYQFIAQVQQDKETGLYIGSIPNLPEAHTQARSLDELNIKFERVNNILP